MDPYFGATTALGGADLAIPRAHPHPHSLSPSLRVVLVGNPNEIALNHL
ncbi:MAG: hypothetical protein JOY82_17680 [Streptosporangiaceae bacterium]|nr:hypothetical protein [Streptosporangiaceae bacterium]MBV9856321.1 hypothetical protein [Streptosporangiaceae bacterium]